MSNLPQGKCLPIRKQRTGRWRRQTVGTTWEGKQHNSKTWSFKFLSLKKKKESLLLTSPISLACSREAAADRGG